MTAPTHRGHYRDDLRLYEPGGAASQWTSRQGGGDQLRREVAALLAGCIRNPDGTNKGLRVRKLLQCQTKSSVLSA